MIDDWVWPEEPFRGIEAPCGDVGDGFALRPQDEILLAVAVDVEEVEPRALQIVLGLNPPVPGERQGLQDIAAARHEDAVVAVQAIRVGKQLEAVARGSERRPSCLVRTRGRWEGGYGRERSTLRARSHRPASGTHDADADEEAYQPCAGLDHRVPFSWTRSDGRHSCQLMPKRSRGTVCRRSSQVRPTPWQSPAARSAVGRIAFGLPQGLTAGEQGQPWASRLRLGPPPRCQRRRLRATGHENAPAERS